MQIAMIVNTIGIAEMLLVGIASIQGILHGGKLANAMNVMGTELKSTTAATAKMGWHAVHAAIATGLIHFVTAPVFTGLYSDTATLLSSYAVLGIIPQVHTHCPVK